MPPPDRTPAIIQELLERAERSLNEAAFLADEIGTEITFRGLRYRPSQVIPGKWVTDEDLLQRFWHG